jgi:glycosyltransferase involved in cell wall biosynthesis
VSQTTTDHANVLVANPSSIPDLMMLAVHLAHAGRLREYVSPLAHRAGSRMIARAPTAIRTELRKRELPVATRPPAVRRAAVAGELLATASRRAGLPKELTRRLGQARSQRFDRATARSVHSGDRAAVVASGAALSTIYAAHRVDCPVLYWYPIAHHAFAERILAEEARRQPEWAETLQFHQFAHQQRTRLDTEIREADAIACLSTFHQRTFAEQDISHERLVLLPLGVDTELFTPGSGRSEDRPFTVAFVGQLTQRKGLSYLLAGFERAAIPGSRLLLVGRTVGTDRPWRHHPAVRHVSHMPRWNLPQVYSSADVFVMPSLVEGFGLTALEAMSCGLPVVLSTNTFGSDIVTDGQDGYIVPIRDADAIAYRLRHLYEHESSRLALARRARATAERYQWQDFGDRVIAVIDQNGAVARD